MYDAGAASKWHGSATLGPRVRGKKERAAAHVMMAWLPSDTMTPLPPFLQKIGPKRKREEEKPENGIGVPSLTYSSTA